jgi:hypothetical protein
MMTGCDVSGSAWNVQFVFTAWNLRFVYAAWKEYKNLSAIATCLPRLHFVTPRVPLSCNSPLPVSASMTFID